MISQYVRCGRLFLQCVDDAESRIYAIPASFTDYFCAVDASTATTEAECHFTVDSLIEVNSILDSVLKTSIE